MIQGCAHGIRLWNLWLYCAGDGDRGTRFLLLDALDNWLCAHVKYSTFALREMKDRMKTMKIMKKKS